MAKKTPAGPDRCERLSLTVPTKRRLWSESGGYCQNPQCAEFLFPDEVDIDFAEMAHIIAATTGGSRDAPKSEMSEGERANHANIAVLCANCHTAVDKAPDSYPVEMMREWKTRHQTKLAIAFGAAEFTSRADARDCVEALLGENRTVFRLYGPDDSFSDERAQRWRHHAVRTIVPNNSKIARILRSNRALLTEAERQTADLFEIHQTEFAARHVLDDFAAGTLTFPAEMSNILKDNG